MINRTNSHVKHNYCVDKFDNLGRLWDKIKYKKPF